MRWEAEFCWKQAELDLETARRKLGTEAYYVCAFMSRRAVEQALKAVFFEKERRLPSMSHNLAHLGETCQLPKRLRATLTVLKQEYLTALSPNGVPSEPFTAKIASRYLSSAERIMEWCQKKLYPPPEAPRRLQSRARAAEPLPETVHAAVPDPETLGSQSVGELTS